MKQNYIEGVISLTGGTPSLRRFIRGSLLGKGGFARVYEVRDVETGKLHAVKIIEKISLIKTSAKQKLQKEIEIHRTLSHPNIVKFEGEFEDSQNHYILMELCNNQTLKELLRKRKHFTELEVQYYMTQLLGALEYLHSLNVIHRDLKLGNLFLGASLEVKLGDFGLAAKLGIREEKRKTVCGTPNYIAPEVLNVKSGSEQTGYSFGVDFWALGVILYALLVGSPPFETKNVRITYRRIRSCDYNIPQDLKVSPEARSLIHRLLSLDPNLRPTMKEILQEPFFTKNSIPQSIPMCTLRGPPSEEYRQHFVMPTRAESAQTITTCSDTVNSRPSIKGIALKNPPRARLTKNNFMLTSPCLRLESRGLMKRSSEQKIKIRPVLLRRPTFPETIKLRPTTSSISSAVLFKEPLIPVYISQFEDYSEKFGIGYQLTNGLFGFYFNDMSNLIFLPSRFQFAYSDFFAFKEMARVYGTQDIPKEIEKKIRVLQHFIKSLEEPRKVDEVIKKPSESRNDGVKKVIKTSNGILFKLNNNIVQMCFTDKSQVILCFNSKRLIYISESGEKHSCQVNRDLFENENEETIEKLKYVLKIASIVNSVSSSTTFTSPTSALHHRIIHTY